MFEQHKNSDASLLVRTDFSNEQAWQTVCELAQRPTVADGFTASLVCVSDQQCANVAPDVAAKQVHKDVGSAVVFIADAQSMEAPEHTILCIDTRNANAASFRVIPSELWGPENNLRLGNMDFDEFANEAQADGVFRGFSP
jgi:ectoine hydroxylase-related dioxygenase (phytanoyl-CoA dioxygenase family)